MSEETACYAKTIDGNEPCFGVSKETLELHELIARVNALEKRVKKTETFLDLIMTFFGGMTKVFHEEV